MKVSVIGLGVMGEAIARNFMKADFPLTVFNRSLAKCEPFRGRAKIASSAREALLASEVTVLTVPSDREIDAILERTGEGRIAAPVEGKIIINMATTAADYSQALAADIAPVGGRYVEAPVSGSRQQAESGTLVVLAAGAPSDIDGLQQLFAAISKATVRCGVPPNAMRMKLANNLLLIALLEALTEACHFAAGSGLDLERFIELVLAGPMANDIFRIKAPKLIARDFAPQASLKHVAKDIRLICEEARRAGINTPAALTNERLFARAVESGLGEDDVVGVLKVLEQF